MLKSRGSTGGAMLLKVGPVGTPRFDTEAPGVGQHGGCATCVQPSGMVYPVLQAAGTGRALVGAHYSGFAETATE